VDTSTIFGGLLMGAAVGAAVSLAAGAAFFFNRGFRTGVKYQRDLERSIDAMQGSTRARVNGEIAENLGRAKYLRDSERRAREAGLIRAGSATIEEILGARAAQIRNGARRWE
jgi:hypothetical protein